MKLDAAPSGPSKVPSLSDRSLPAALDQRARLISLLLAFITVLVYLPVRWYPFINYDDLDYVTENPVVQNGLTWAGLKWAFIGWHASNWHPLTWLSHELDCQLFGLNAGAHHLVNVLFHAANAMLLFQLWRQMTKALWPSAVVAALFAWHPLHVESVAWVAERKDVLSTFFGLLAMLAYARYVAGLGKPELRPRLYFGLSLLAFALGLLAKPMLVTLPFVLVLLDYWPLQRFNRARVTFQEGGRLLWEKWPFFLLVVFSCLLTFLAQRGDAVDSLRVYPFHYRLENIVTAYASYLAKTVWPAHLCINYPLTIRFTIRRLVLSTLVLVVISGLAWRGREHRYLVTGWLWFLGMLVPVIGLVQLGNAAMADRYMYLPATGLFIMVVFGIAEARSRVKVPATVVAAAAVLVLAGCVAATEFQLRFWRSSTALFEQAVAVTSNNTMARMMLGTAYETEGRDAEAQAQFRQVLNMFGDTRVRVDGGEMRLVVAEVELLFGAAAQQKGQFAEATAHYREALRRDPDIPEAHNNLGNLLDILGKPDEALAEYQAAERLRPQTPLVHENLGAQLARMGRMDEAMREFQEAARLAPTSSQPYYLMGKAWLRHGNSAEAIVDFKDAVRLSPDDWHSLVYLAQVLAADESSTNRDGAQAVALAERANQLTGARQPLVLGALAMAYAEAGRFAEARKAAQNALDAAAGGSPGMISNLQSQLKLYEAGQPDRESFTNR